MGVLGRIGAVVVMGLLSCVCAQAADVVNDLSAMQFMDHYKGPDQGKELLKQNGFVVVQRFYHRISGPYADNTLPHYVTTDSVYNTFHIIFEDLLKEVEADCAEQVLQITQKTQEALKTVPQDGVAAILAANPDAKALADQFFQVAECLLSDKEVPADIHAVVRDELVLITAAAGPTLSPLFKYDTDYSQFKPRGFYTSSKTLERYFRAMSWYGNMAFRVVDERESMAALLIAQSLNGNEELKSAWAKIDRLYSYLLAPSDGLTPLEYAALLPSLSASKGAGEAWAAFGHAAATLRGPKINDMVFTPDQMADWRKLSKGMRFFGKHYIPDSEAFMNLTDPAVPGRGFPSGLDVMAVNGSARAAELAKQGPGTQNPAYDKGLAKSKELFATATTVMPPAPAPSFWARFWPFGGTNSVPQPTHYAQFLKLLSTINAPVCPEAPAFAKTAAYNDKNLMTVLSAWASMRHAWALHAKQSMIYLGLSEDKPLVGYVEPNLAFFEAMHALIAKTGEVFAGFKGVDIDRLNACDKLVLRLADLIKKELSGTIFSTEDVESLLSYGFTISALQGFETNALIDENMPMMALVSDVHTELQSQECLEVALGGAMPIYVIVERDGKPTLMIGGVCSYYEFRQPINDRLTDETWRSRWSTGRVPGLPTWTSTFVAGQFGMEAIIERIQKGEKPDEAYYINDPKFCDFLEAAVQPGSALYDTKGYGWLLSLSTAKVGRKMVPLLLEQVRTGNTKIGDGMAHAAFAAAEAFRFVITPDDLPALREIMLVGDRDRLWAARDCLIGLKDDVRTEFLLSLYQATDNFNVRNECLSTIARGSSKDVTPTLMALWKQGDAIAKVQIGGALGGMWTPKHPELASMMPAAQASERQQAGWAAAVRNLVLQTLQQGQPAEIQGDRDARIAANMAWGDLLSLAGRLKLDEAVPVLMNAKDRGHIDRRALEGLSAMGTARSIEALVDLTRTESGYPLCEILEKLEKIKSPATIQRLRELLVDKSNSNCTNGRRICDEATMALKAILPDGPDANEHGGSDTAQNDANIEVWQAYLDKKYPANK